MIEKKVGEYDAVRQKLMFLNSEIDNIENFFKKRSEDVNLSKDQLVRSKTKKTKPFLDRTKKTSLY